MLMFDLICSGHLLSGASTDCSNMLDEDLRPANQCQDYKRETTEIFTNTRGVQKVRKTT